MKRPIASSLFLTIATLLGIAAPAVAAGREVLVLSAPGLTGGMRDESPYMAVEAILNHMGLIARYHDVSGPVPTAQETAQARGVISLVEGNWAQDPTGYDKWLANWLDSRRPLYLLGGPGVLQASHKDVNVEPALWQGILSRLGMRVDPSDPWPLHVTVNAGKKEAFEGTWKPAPAFTGLTSTDPKNQVFLQERDDSTGQTADLGVLGPHGAFSSATDCIFKENPLTYGLRWRVDPFWLFAPLKTPGEPALDTTTLNGRRLFYAHIDGDGFSNRAHMRGTPYAAEVVKDQVLERTWLPTTASIIVREVIHHPRLEAIARAIFKLPNVLVATHTYTHPFDWVTGAITKPGENTDSSGTTSTALRIKLSPRHELDDSINYIQTLLPPGKKVEAVLWSGAANPREPFLQRAAELGIGNLNGGNPILDTRFPSYANLMPIAHRVGPYWQIFSSCANENIFTNLWTGPFDGQMKALALYQFTEAPKRMSPVNIYYHYYSAERLAGLATLQNLYHWAEKQPLCPVSVADYCAIANGFFSGQVTPAGPGAWLVSDAGACRTLRFDDETGGVDLAQSTGVAGFNHANGSLYVHLTASQARVVLSAKPPSTPYLASANAPLTQWEHQARSLQATFKSLAPITLRFAGFQANEPVSIHGPFTGDHKADQQGYLTLHAPAGLQTVELGFS